MVKKRSKKVPKVTSYGIKPLPKLLTLPLEIRLCIYDYTTEAEEEIAVLTLPRKVRYGSLHYYTPPTRCPPKRIFRSLTQTCHQLREEFLPIYNSRLPHHFPLTSLLPYIRTFFPAQNSQGQVITSHSGTLHIYYERYVWDRTAINIFPLIELVQRNPKVRLEFLINRNRAWGGPHTEPIQPRLSRELDGLFSRSRPSLLTYVAAQTAPIARINLEHPGFSIAQQSQHGGDCMALRIVFEGDFPQPWMRDGKRFLRLAKTGLGQGVSTEDAVMVEEARRFWEEIGLGQRSPKDVQCTVILQAS